jgi:hypothetical protein
MNDHPFLGLKFLPLLRSLLPMPSEVTIHLPKLYLHPAAASEKFMDFRNASHFIGLRFPHQLKSFLNVHSMDAPH